MSDQSKTPAKTGSPDVVIFIHASGMPAIEPGWLSAVHALGFTVYSRRRLEGCEQTRHGLKQPAQLLREINSLAPGHAVLILRAGLIPASDQLESLLEAIDHGNPDAITTLSNADPELNPYADLAPPDSWNADQRSDLVKLLAQRELSPCTGWPVHLLLLSPVAVTGIASGWQAGERPSDCLLRLGGSVRLAHWLFVEDSLTSIHAKPELEAHESRRPPAWSGLAARLSDWIHSDARPDPLSGRSAPVTLHVTHDWGGGVAQWIRTFIDTNKMDQHLQLVAEGPQSGRGFGQRLALYAGNERRCPVDNWWLQPPVRSSCDHNEQVKAVLRDISQRFGIGRIMISSLIGHSLDVLRTGLPTLLVMHDHYPVWPLLSINPEPYLRAGKPVDLARALEENNHLAEFPEQDPDHWQRLGDALFQILESQQIRIAAPGQSVVTLQSRLDPRWASLAVETIEHGVPALENTGPVEPRGREDGRLRLLIPGRIQAGKGQNLLLEALPAITPYVRVFLLGAGEEGERFFGLPGVDVVLQYERDDLPALLAQIGPHMAALLSVVPETFSYTLTEMWQMGIPVIATRVGSLADRIRDNETGWLIDPHAEALIGLIQQLAKEPKRIESVRQELRGYRPQSARDMLDRYQVLCPPQKMPPAPSIGEPGLDAIQAGAALHAASVARSAGERQARRIRDMNKELRRRAEWAADLDSLLKAEQERRREWVARLETELADVYRQRDESIQMLDQSQQMLMANQKRLDQVKSELEALAETHRQILASSSWRLTRPLRVARRMAANLHQQRIWNPLNWPMLLARLVRNLSTFGISGTLQRMQTGQQQFIPEEKPGEQVEPVGNPNAPARVPRPEFPRVSIVIPVYNQWNYTAACLRSLVETQGTQDFEVIIVDDHSSDETMDRLPTIEGLVHHRNNENLGFIGSCNAGAALARGEYLVLLNNDTQVLDYWLDRLLQTFREHPGTGMAGARLLYANGSLQESGGLVFNDASGWNYGRNGQPDNPEYLFTREVDYCSGACIMLPLDLFNDIGGLDSHYAPAYYEDTDLAFQVRARGLRVMVQAAAAVIHHEGITAGTDITSSTKRYQSINRDKFAERWADDLAQMPAPIENPADLSSGRAARDHRLRGRVLIIDAFTPEPDQDSGSLRMTNLMQCFLDLGYGVTFFADNRSYAGRYTQRLQARGVEMLYAPWIDSLPDFFSQRGGEFCLVIISRYHVAVNYLPWLKRFCADTPFVFDTVDLHYLREQRHAELENSRPLRHAAQQTKRSELAVIKAATATLVVSPVEQEVLAQDAPEASVHVLSNIHEVAGCQAAFDERRDIFFVGGFQHPPNIDAVLWFVKEVWPLIHKRLPDVLFHLIGSKATERIRSLDGDGVVFHGFVDDLDPYLDGCRLAVAPLRYGAGVKGKVNMSMSRGQPVVATPMAVEGMHAEHGREILVAESATEFADEVVRLYGDQALWEALSGAAVENVEAHFSLQAAKRSLQALLKNLRPGAD
jgi:GT2 family glycosyltransferase/glycosyltransferase involved in cell wall biosynthesis